MGVAGLVYSVVADSVIGFSLAGLALFVLLALILELVMHLLRRVSKSASLLKDVRNIARAVAKATSSPGPTTSKPSVAKGGSAARQKQVDFAPWELEAAPAPRRGVRVAVILDDFSRLALRYEWDQVEITSSGWEAELTSAVPEMLFIESAWAGNEGSWKYHLTGSSAPRQPLIDLIAWCRERNVPTVFWNKEDPAHFEDFIETASLFDWVFTTDVNMVALYRERLGHDRVGVLGFGVQERIHNPVRRRGGAPSGDVAFAGMYFAHKYPERRRQMELLLGAALRASRFMPRGLDIFSRQLGGDERYQFPEPFAGRVVGSLSYEKMLAAYREYKVFLNVNSVVDSPSMCARRIFEISACGTPVVSTPSAAVTSFFPPDEVFVVSDEDSAERTLRALVASSELRERAAHLAQRRIWRNHTYNSRVQAVLSSVGLASSAQLERPSVSAIVPTRRPEQLDHVLRTVASQRDVRAQLVLLTHGFALPDADMRARAEEHGIVDLVLLSADSSVPLGECLNRLVAAADGEVVAKMDDDDLYGEHYLSDQVHALGYSGAEVVGKKANYLYLKSMNATLLKFPDGEHRYTDFVAGATLVTTRELARKVPFMPVGRGEDSRFLNDVKDEGARVYSTDRFNFIVMRNDRPLDHTWKVTDLELLANGRVVQYGEMREHVLF